MKVLRDILVIVVLLLLAAWLAVHITHSLEPGHTLHHRSNGPTSSEEALFQGGFVQ